MLNHERQSLNLGELNQRFKNGGAGGGGKDVVIRSVSPMNVRPGGPNGGANSVLGYERVGEIRQSVPMTSSNNNNGSRF